MQTDSPFRWIRRHLFKLSQADMATLARVSRPRISRYETGGEDPPFKVMKQIRDEARARGLPFSAELFFQDAAERATAVPEDVQ